MHRFGDGDQKKPGDDIREPHGDLEAARAIRALCQSAVVDNEQEQRFIRLGNRHEGNGEPKSARRARAARAAMEMALKISDPLVRDSAIRQIIGLCMISGDVKAAKILAGAIQTESIRREALNEYPVLRSEPGGAPTA
jgi:hypothetical protein